MGPLAIIYNGKNQKNADFARELCEYIRSAGGYVLDSAPDGCAIRDQAEYDFSACAAVITLGGDGTILSAARRLAPLGVPLYGVNMGRLGFLAAVEPAEALHSVDLLLSGQYAVQERLMLTGEVWRDGERVLTCSALNEIVINSGMTSRSVNLELFVDGEQITSYNTDGIIVSSPTGSTGYAFSAGGPIIMEEVKVLLITPVCPHTFFSRPIVAQPDSRVEIISRSQSSATSLSADGQVHAEISCGDRIVISRAPYSTRIIHFGGGTLFERIKTKLYV